MKKTNYLTSLFAKTTLALLILVNTAWTPTQKGCHKINAKASGQTISQSMNGAITQADLIGGGILNGTTRAEFDFIGPPDSQTGELPFAGILTLTTKHGTLTFDATNGMLNPATGAFSTEINVVNGTGRFSSATGTLYISGFTNLANGLFTEDINGEICL